MTMIRSFTSCDTKTVSELRTPVFVADPVLLDFVKVFAVWDTGATNSVITKGTAQKCGLIPSGVDTPSK